MAVYGDIKELKKAIEQDYAQKLREVNREKDARIKEIKARANNELGELKTAIGREIEEKKAETRAMVLNEKKMEAKNKFEESREEMIQTVLDDAVKRFPEVMKGKKYSSFVKKYVPAGADVFGNPFFKKQYKKLKPETGVSGLRFVKGEIQFNLSLEALLEAKEFSARQKVIETLW